MNDKPSTPRGDLMREMAAIQNKLDTLGRNGIPVDQISEKRRELEQQLDELRQKAFR